MDTDQAIDLASVFRHCGDVRYRIIDDEAVVIRQEAGEVLGLNQTAARLLDLIDGKLAVRDLVDKMVEEFETDRSALEKDVVKFLKDLLHAGVIEEVKSERG
jgi:hypothetical protein